MNLRARLVGLTATLLLVGIVLALPITLIALGAAPIPTHLPSADQIRSSLASPDDGTLALGAIKVIAWLAWAVLTWFITVEIVARLRGITITPPRGLAMPQLAVRGLVAAAALLFISAGSAAPAIALTTSAPHAVASAGLVPGAAAPANTMVVDVRDHAPHSSPAPKTPAVSSLPTHTVVHGESLWSIAQTHLGSGERYRDILAVNPQLGSHPDFLTPGTVLHLPAAHQAADRPEHQVTVHRGDTLSGIAQRELGDADRYPEIYDASRGIRQPGGYHLSDPDMIDVGWTLTIPGTPPTPTTTTTPTPPSPPPPVAPPPPTPSATTPPVTPSPSATSASPTASAPATSAQAQEGQSTVVAEAEHPDSPAPWILAGLTGAGAVLAGGMTLVLRARRRTQFRNRRPGRSITAPDPVLAPVEKTVMTLGSAAAPTVEFLDDALRALAGACTGRKEHLPDVAAVTLNTDAITVHLSRATTLPEPWQGDEEQLRWRLPTGAAADSIGTPQPDQPAPYPLLVTIGAADDGTIWLFNLEDLNVAITGDLTYATDLARNIAAEIAVNPWSTTVQLDCIGVGQELEPIHPGRMCTHPVADAPRIAAELLTDAVAVVDRSTRLDLPVSTARALQADSDSWGARMLLIDAGVQQCPELDQLIELLGHHDGHTGTAVVINGRDDTISGSTATVTMQLSEAGRLLVPSVGLDLIAAGLTSDEAQGCAALLAMAGDNPPDAPTPVDHSATHGWRSMVDQAGSLRVEHTLPRSAQPADIDEPAASVLAQDDQTYLATGVTTTEDLQALAPLVTDTTRARLKDADPDLDADVAAWFDPDCALPRLSLIGPVSARTRGKPIASRKPYFTEMLAYLALKPHGATPEELADTFYITPTKAREYARTIRTWLGTDPRTGTLHLPHATDAPSAKTRGMPLYEVSGVLVDAQLLYRLRARGEAAGPDGIDDLRTALRLVNGRPFSQLRNQGWAWLFEGDRLDHHLVCAIVDIAHLVITHDLAEGNVPGAQLAAETAILAAPDDEIARLGMASVAKAAGHAREAERIVREQICDRTDDAGPPPELAERTEQILTVNQWLTPGKVAS